MLLFVGCISCLSGKNTAMTHNFYFSFKKLDIIKVLRKESLQYPYPVLTSRLPCALYVISVTSNLGNLALSSLTHCFLSCINLSFSICRKAAQVPSGYLSTAEIQIGSGIPSRHLTGHDVVGLHPSLSTATSCWVYAEAELQHLQKCTAKIGGILRYQTHQLSRAFQVLSFRPRFS